MDKNENTLGERVRARREEIGMSQAELARAARTTQATIDKIENNRSRQSKFLPAVFLSLGLPLEEIIDQTTHSPRAKGNATIGPKVALGATGERIPVYGQAIGGDDGRFVLNGNKIADILAPPDLVGVREAYAVYVVGESMDPRYRAGAIAYVNPGLPVVHRDGVVVQIRDPEDPETPHAYVKEFVSMDNRRLRVRQFNPPKEIEFPKEQVVSIHKIILAG